MLKCKKKMMKATAMEVRKIRKSESENAFNVLSVEFKSLKSPQNPIYRCLKGCSPLVALTTWQWRELFPIIETYRIMYTWLQSPPKCKRNNRTRTVSMRLFCGMNSLTQKRWSLIRFLCTELATLAPCLFVCMGQGTQPCLSRHLPNGWRKRAQCTHLTLGVTALTSATMRQTWVRIPWLLTL